MNETELITDVEVVNECEPSGANGWEIIELDTEFYSLDYIPEGAYINKTVCGCGMTSTALENQRNTIVVVPNVSLIENKVEQYKNPDERLMARTSFKVLGVYGSVTRDGATLAIREQIENQGFMKVMVTYDSLWKVIDWMDREDLNVQLIIDESEQVIRYAKLKVKADKSKSCTEFIFEMANKYMSRTSFISATPIPVEYMPSFISEMKLVEIRFTTAIKVGAIQVLNRYPLTYVKQSILLPILSNGVANIIDGSTMKTIFSFKKAIIFINSIADMMEMLEWHKRHFLIDCSTKEDVGFIIGDNFRNDMSIKEYGFRVADPRVLPKITFVTSSGIRGIDLYDKDAMTIVIANSNKTHKMLDMLSDLKQAASRQRDKTNEFYGKYLFVFNQTITEDSIASEMAKFQSDYVRCNNVKSVYYKSKGQSEIFTNLEVQSLRETLNKETYLYLNDSNDVVFNESLYLSDKYQTEILIRQYLKGFAIGGEDDHKIQSCLAFKVNGYGYEDMVKYAKSNIDKVTNEIKWTEAHFVRSKDYAELISAVYKATGRFQMNKVQAEAVLKRGNVAEIEIDIKYTFVVGEDYTGDKIKDELSRLYERYGLKRKAKVTDLGEFLEYKTAKVMNQRTMKWDSMYRIVKHK